MGMNSQVRFHVECGVLVLLLIIHINKLRSSFEMDPHQLSHCFKRN